MTTFERFERDIPELMTELAPASVPDYFDDMLRQTASHRQRPAWSYPERWLPMGVLARTNSLRQPLPWRPIAVLALLLLLIAAGLAAYVGAPPRIPAPFGPARNGQIIFATAGGDIAAIDPATRVVTQVITGPTHDLAPWLAPDGRHFVFVRVLAAGDAYFIADANGANVRQLVEPPIEWFEWSPTADRIVVRHIVDGTPVASVVDVATGTATRLDPGVEVQDPTWRPNHDQILFSSDAPAGFGYYLVNPDGTALQRLSTAAGTVNDPSVSPDGSLIAYATWEDGQPALQGRIHVLDVDRGIDRSVLFDGSVGTEELNPRFSPDGTKLLIERYEAVGGYRLVVVPVDGVGPAIILGDRHPEGTNGAPSIWSPDGASILTTYGDDHRSWLLAADGSKAEEVTWTTTDGFTWQRLAS